MFKEIECEGRFAGLMLTTPSYRVFFGARVQDRSMDSLAGLFPQSEFSRLKQVHGKHIVQASDQIVAADGHFTSESKRALVVETADCLPVIFCHPKKIICIHAGWRGLASGILGQTQNLLQEPVEWKVFIGPHIMAESFEVGQDVGLTLQQSSPNPTVDLTRKHSDPKKVFFDLTLLARQQLESLGIRAHQIECIGLNTMTDKRFASFRRDQMTSGRNFSFGQLT